MEESLTPHLKDMLAAKLQEMAAEEMDETVEEEVVEEESVEEGSYEKDEMDETVEEVEAPVAEEDEPAEDDAEESEDEAEEEAEEGEEEAEEIEDMNVEDLKNLIRDIIAQEMGGGEDLEGEEGIEDLGMDDEEGGVEDMVAADDEEINLEELLAELEALSEEEETEDIPENPEDYTKQPGYIHEEVAEEVQESSELNEALETIEVLRKELSEVNLLNSKLLYVNKIFKAHNLSEAQKVNIITTFDKAETVKEVKLVYETVAENIGTPKSKTTQIKEHKSFASKPAGNSTKGEVISEVSDQVRRMQKLAGIIK
jgi:hypothetical protein